MSTLHTTRPATATRIGARTARLATGAAALLLGMLLLYGVGLAQPHALHEAAHDTRHHAGLPCH